MANKSIAIIGAGLAGLSIGCYAQMNGYSSHIFEHHARAGGVAAAWERQDYLIDGGIHFLMGHRPGQPIYDLYCELGIAQNLHVLDMTTYGRFVDEASGWSADVTTDLDRLARDLKALSPADAAIVDDLIAHARGLQGSGVLYDSGMAKPPELTSLGDQLGQLWGMRRVWRYFTGRYGRPMADYARQVQHPVLRRLLENLFLPEVPVWFVCMLLALLADRQIGLLEGGCLDFVRQIEERYRTLGGQVTYQATVEEILVENDRAVGVRLADGSEHRADVVVSAADGYSTIFRMLNGRYVDEKIKDRYATWKLIRPAVTASFGVRRELSREPHLSVIMLKDPVTVGSQVVDGLFVRILNYSTRFAPPGKTVIQAGFDAEWDYWNDLQQDRPRYDAAKEQVAAEILARLEAHYPGISPQVEVVDVATPYTTWRYTLNHRGAYMGWLPTREALMTSIRRTLPGLSNFYMAGQWVLPGGGVPPCLWSGRHVVEILCRKDGRRFSTTIA